MQWTVNTSDAIQAAWRFGSDGAYKRFSVVPRSKLSRVFLSVWFAKLAHCCYPCRPFNRDRLYVELFQAELLLLLLLLESLLHNVVL